jgi:molecular chaperone DnaK
MTNYVGIDLGTTYSAAAYIDESGRPTIISNDRDQNITPSCVAKIKGEIVVGERARRQWGNDEANAAARFKRDMGTSETHSIDGSDFTPTELSAAVIKNIKDYVEEKVGPISEAVITIPANFSQEARDATMEAGRLNGLNVKYIINEPTAAALYYAYQSDGDLSGTYVVYDLGGGTFDVSVIRVRGQEVEVVASNGLHKLGGDDFDRCLWELIASKYKDEVGSELTKEDFPINDVEEEKKSLSARKRTTVEIDRELIDVTRIEFEESISSLMAQIEMMCESTLDEANVTQEDITSVFLAGGSTRIPRVIESVKKVFKQEPISTVNVDEVVALGACLYAAFKSDGTNLSEIQKKSVSKLKVSEVTNECFGTITIGYSESKGEALHNSILIQKGQSLPCTVTETFYTTHAGQTAIDCTITESKSPETNPKFVKIIHQEDLQLPPNRPTNQEIEVSYSYDENQMMHASFKDVASNEETKISLSRASGAGTNSEIDKFLVD